MTLQMTQNSNFYVLENIEVKKTGRIAVRQAALPGKKAHELVEVTPANENDGSWTKWVTESSLYRIVDSNSK